MMFNNAGSETQSSLLLNEKQVAATLGVSLSFLRQRRCQNEGPPFVRLGKLCRYPADELRTWLAKQGTGRTGSVTR